MVTKSRKVHYIYGQTGTLVFVIVGIDRSHFTVYYMESVKRSINSCAVFCALPPAKRNLSFVVIVVCISRVMWLRCFLCATGGKKSFVVSSSRTYTYLGIKHQVPSVT